MSDREALKASIDGLSPMGVRFVARMADCAYLGNPTAARVSLDRSDAKITVKQIQLSVCDIHAEWALQP